MEFSNKTSVSVSGSSTITQHCEDDGHPGMVPTSFEGRDIATEQREGFAISVKHQGVLKKVNIVASAVTLTGLTHH